jgi:hypothetical protein
MASWVNWRPDVVSTTTVYASGTTMKLLGASAACRIPRESHVDRYRRRKKCPNQRSNHRPGFLWRPACSQNNLAALQRLVTARRWWAMAWGNQDRRCQPVPLRAQLRSLRLLLSPVSAFSAWPKTLRLDHSGSTSFARSSTRSFSRPAGAATAAAPRGLRSERASAHTGLGHSDLRGRNLSDIRSAGTGFSVLSVLLSVLSARIRNGHGAVRPTAMSQCSNLIELGSYRLPERSEA